jgi:hypothetical protein
VENDPSCIKKELKFETEEGEPSNDGNDQSSSRRRRRHRRRRQPRNWCHSLLKKKVMTKGKGPGLVVEVRDKGWIAVKLDSGGKIKSRPGDVKAIDDAKEEREEEDENDSDENDSDNDNDKLTWCQSLLNKKVMTKDKGPGLVVEVRDKGWIAVQLDSGAKIKSRPGNVKAIDDVKEEEEEEDKHDQDDDDDDDDDDCTRPAKRHRANDVDATVVKMEESNDNDAEEEDRLIASTMMMLLASGKEISSKTFTSSSSSSSSSSVTPALPFDGCGTCTVNGWARFNGWEPMSTSFSCA